MGTITRRSSPPLSRTWEISGPEPELEVLTSTLASGYVGRFEMADLDERREPPSDLKPCLALGPGTSDLALALSVDCGMTGYGLWT